MRGRLALAVIALAIAAPPVAAQAGGYRVIVNAANPVTQLSRQDLSKMFLKKLRAWKGAGEVQPVDLGEDATARQAFSREVHRKDVRAVKAYWQQLIFTGQGAPPVEKGSDDEVIAFVARSPASIGYVSAAATLGPGVKLVHVVE